MKIKNMHPALGRDILSLNKRLKKIRKFYQNINSIIIDFDNKLKNSKIEYEISTCTQFNEPLIRLYLNHQKELIQFLRIVKKVSKYFHTDKFELTKQDQWIQYSDKTIEFNLGITNFDLRVTYTFKDKAQCHFEDIPKIYDETILQKAIKKSIEETKKGIMFERKIVCNEKEKEAVNESN